MTQVWSCGGGRQSAGVAALIIQGRLPKPDIVAMADTGREKSSTWRYVFDVMQPALRNVGVELVIVPKDRYATVDLYRNDDLLIPAFTTINGSVSKMPGFCSNEWKARVIDRWLRDQGVPASSYLTWLGFSANELRRVKQGPYRYVLIWDVRLFSEDCLSLAEQVLGVAPPLGGSCCWMCPNMSDPQWIEMRENDPADFRKACEFDNEIRRKDPHVFIHSSGTPLETAELGNPNQQTLGCDSGYCHV